MSDRHARPTLATTTARIALLLLFSTTPATAFSPDYETSYTSQTTNLRAHLLANYDKVVPPRSTRLVNYSNAGTDVRVEVRFFKVESIASAEGRMKLKVWLRMYWDDMRLAWDPADWGGVTKTYFQGMGLTAPEDSEIWLPDVQPYNSMVGIANTLDPSIAVVQNTGEVFWSRPGVLDVLCRFSGLVAFPFDKLRCSIEMGGWMVGAGHQGVQFHRNGSEFSEQETTSGSSYQEHSIVNWRFNESRSGSLHEPANLHCRQRVP